MYSGVLGSVGNTLVLIWLCLVARICPPGCATDRSTPLMYNIGHEVSYHVIDSSVNVFPLLTRLLHMDAKKRDFLCLCHYVGVHKTLRCPVTRLLEVRCAKKPKTACYSLVPDRQKQRGKWILKFVSVHVCKRLNMWWEIELVLLCSTDVWTYNIRCSRDAIKVYHQHCRRLKPIWSPL